MKNLMSFLLASAVSTCVFAQGADAKKTQPDPQKSKQEIVQPGLNERSFKISFTQRAVDVKPGTDKPASEKISDANHDKPDYSAFDANSRVMLTFSKGNLISPIFAEACPYRMNASGNEMYAFSAYCRLSSGKETKATNTEESSLDSKMKMDADHAESEIVNNPGRKEPEVMPVDETNKHIPPGMVRDENAGTTPVSTPVTTPQSTPATIPASPPGAAPSKNNLAPVQIEKGPMAKISGVITGNSIQGTLSWTEADGRMVSYSYSGNAATKKDLNESSVVGMK